MLSNKQRPIGNIVRPHILARDYEQSDKEIGRKQPFLAVDAINHRDRDAIVCT